MLICPGVQLWGNDGWRSQFIALFRVQKKHATVDGRNPANQLRLVVYPIIYMVLYIPAGAGCLSLGLFFSQ